MYVGVATALEQNRQLAQGLAGIGLLRVEVRWPVVPVVPVELVEPVEPEVGPFPFPHF